MRDVEVRVHLRTHLAQLFASDPSTIIVDELGIRQGLSRIDVAAVNGHFYGYEIKAAADDLTRLERQIDFYSQVVDYAILVTATEHLKAARQLLPRWWGILEVRSAGDRLAIKSRRQPKLNPDLDVRSLAELLWHGETLELLRARDALRGVKSKPRRFAWDRLCDTYEVDEIREVVRNRLKARKGH